jgi:DNA-binding MarR family transcriptional regulator
VVRGIPGDVLSTGRTSGQKGSRIGSPSRRRLVTDFEREFPGGSESANACAMALVHTGESLLACFDQALRHHHLSRAGREALAVLDGAGQPLSPTAIAERLIVTTASVTSLLDTLERRGLVERRPDPTDRRRLLIVITPDGKAIVDQFLPEVVALQTAALATLTEAQRRQLVELLTTLGASLTTLDADKVIRAAAPRGVPRQA